MNGQARALAERAACREAGLPTLVVASGKGGVGKTSLAVALAVALERLGVRVLLADMDLGLGNVGVLLGRRPRAGLRALLEGARPKDLVTPGPGGVSLILGDGDDAGLALAAPRERRRLLRALRRAEGLADALVLDAGAGASDVVLDLLARADLGVVVTTPEPTSYSDAYALAKLLARRDPKAARRLRLLVNRATDEGEARAVAAGLSGIAERFLGQRLPALGWLPEDPAVARAVRRQECFVLGASPAARSASALAPRLWSELAAAARQRRAA